MTRAHQTPPPPLVEGLVHCWTTQAWLHHHVVPLRISPTISITAGPLLNRYDRTVFRVLALSSGRGQLEAPNPH